MSEVTRRELLVLALAASRGIAKPRLFNAHEFATLTRLTELIIPGAAEAGAPEFIDFLSTASPELAAIYTGGLAWLDAESHARSGTDFLAAPPGQQTAVLDGISHGGPGPGAAFFEWARNMTVDAYFTSPAGMKYLGYMGNGAVSEFSVPEEAIAYALKRSPV